MAKKRRFTFKKEPKETGLRAVGHPHQSVTIKRDGKQVGRILAPSWNHRGWLVGLMINRPEKDNPNCSWSWWFPGSFETEQEARDWLNGDLYREPACGLRFSDVADDSA